MHCENKKKYVTHFILIFAELWWSGTKSAISLRYACLYCTNPHWWNPFVCNPKETSNVNLLFNSLKQLKDNCTESNSYSEVWIITWFYFLHCLGYKLYIDFIFLSLSFTSHAFLVDDDLRKMSFKVLAYDLC